jgi:uncharacterized protein YndB with AHSA1/START domain
MTTTTTDTRTLVIERQLPQSPTIIWQALTDSALIERWLMKNDFAPVVGRTFTFRAAPQPYWNGITDGEVLAVEPERHLSYRWNASGEEAATGVKTIVDWTLTPASGGTRLRLEQSGFRPGQEANYQGAMYGWTNFLGALEGVVAASER